MIGRKRLERYDGEAGSLLVNYVSKFNRVLTTSHVLAETSNLAAQIVDRRARDELFTKFHPLFCLVTPESFGQCAVLGENVDSKLFSRIGLTDSCLASLVQRETLLLTDDLDLYVAAVATHGQVINFTHMREAFGTL